MSPDQSNESLASLSGFQHVLRVIYCAAWSAAAAFPFMIAISQRNLPAAVALILMIPVMWGFILYQWLARTVKFPRFFPLGLAGFAIVWVIALIRLMTLPPAIFSFPTSIEGSLAALEWFGVATLAFSDLFVVVALRSAMLARLRPSA